MGSGGWLRRFWRQPNRAYRNFVVIYTILVLNFLIPAASYYIDRDAATTSFYRIGSLFGAERAASEDSYIWWILGAGNVLTLAVMCAMLLVNLRRFYPILPALVALKGFSSIGFTVLFVAGPHNMTFLAAGVLDGVTVAAMLYFAIHAHRAIERDPTDLVPRPVDTRRLLTLGRGSRERVRNVAAAVVPAGADPQLPRGAGSDEVVGVVALQIERAPLQAGLGFRAAFSFVHMAPLLILGRPRTLKRLSPADADRYMQRLESHRSYLVRQTFLLVKTAVAIAYMGQGDQRGRLGAYQLDALGSEQRPQIDR